MPNTPKKLSPAKFVSGVVKDPKTPVENLLLFGFVGDSSEPDHTRLYFDPQLSSYVEIPDEAILHSQEIPPAQSRRSSKCGHQDMATILCATAIGVMRTRCFTPLKSSIHPFAHPRLLWERQESRKSIDRTVPGLAAFPTVEKLQA